MNFKVTTVLSLVLGAGLGVFSTVLYYENLASELRARSSMVVENVVSNGNADQRQANKTEVDGPSAATVAKMREVEELIFNSNDMVAVAPPIAPASAKSYSASESVPIEPAPVDPPVFSERDRQQAALTISGPREIGEFIEVASPPLENGLRSSKKLTQEQINTVSETIAQ